MMVIHDILKKHMCQTLHIILYQKMNIQVSSVCYLTYQKVTHTMCVLLCLTITRLIKYSNVITVLKVWGTFKELIIGRNYCKRL